jgi:hypothetical protein
MNKYLSIMLLVLLPLVLTACGAKPEVKKPEPVKTIETNTVDLQEEAYQTARTGFIKVVRDIPFKVKSSAMNLNDPKYVIEGTSIDTFMKKIILPNLIKLVNVLPADKKVVIIGNASKTGTEEASGSYIGNAALSQARAEAVLDYILKNSSLDRSRFTIRANGSTRPIEGTMPQDPINCRVRLDIE